MVKGQESFFCLINRFLDLDPSHVFFVTKRVIEISTVKHFVEV